MKASLNRTYSFLFIVSIFYSNLLIAEYPSYGHGRGYYSPGCTTCGNNPVINPYMGATITPCATCGPSATGGYSNTYTPTGATTPHAVCK